MKQLLILRHAKSSWQQAGLADHDRPLNERGERDAPRMGRLLEQEQIVPDLIVSSTALRAIETAREVARASGTSAVPRTDRRLYTGDPGDYLTVLRELETDADTVLLVGHNPVLEALVLQLTARELRMPTAALVRVVLPVERWDELGDDTQGELRGVWRPKELPPER